MAPDEATGEPTFISSFLKPTAMPLSLATGRGHRHRIAGERRVFKPTRVTWDDARGICIVEIVWLVADVARYAEAVDEAEPWPA